MRQVEISRTLVFDDPAAPAASSERSLPTTSRSAAPKKSRSCSPAASPRPPGSPFRTRVFSAGTDVRIDFRYKHSRVKQYLKYGRALQIETVINKASDVGVLARLQHLPELIAKARAVNHRLLMIEQAGQRLLAKADGSGRALSRDAPVGLLALRLLLLPGLSTLHLPLFVALLEDLVPESAEDRDDQDWTPALAISKPISGRREEGASRSPTMIMDTATAKPMPMTKASR